MVGENSSSENGEILYDRASCYEHMGNVGLSKWVRTYAKSVSPEYSRKFWIIVSRRFARNLFTALVTECISCLVCL